MLKTRSNKKSNSLFKQLQRRETSAKSFKIKHYKVFHKITTFDNEALNKLNPNYKFLCLNTYIFGYKNVANPAYFDILRKYTYNRYLYIYLNPLITKYYYKGNYYDILSVSSNRKNTLYDIFYSIEHMKIKESERTSTRSNTMNYNKITDKINKDLNIFDYVYIINNIIYIYDNDDKMITHLNSETINILNKIPNVDSHNKIILKKNKKENNIHKYFFIEMNQFEDEDYFSFTFVSKSELNTVITIIINDLNDIQYNVKKLRYLQSYEFNILAKNKDKENFYVKICDKYDEQFYSIVQLIYISPEIVEKFNSYFASHNIYIKFILNKLSIYKRSFLTIPE